MWNGLLKDNFIQIDYQRALSNDVTNLHSKILWNSQGNSGKVTKTERNINCWAWTLKRKQSSNSTKRMNDWVRFLKPRERERASERKCVHFPYNQSLMCAVSIIILHKKRREKRAQGFVVSNHWNTGTEKRNSGFIALGSFKEKMFSFLFPFPFFSLFLLFLGFVRFYPQ